MSVAPPLPPGGVIGILGGGQLGRMTALAAAALGYRCHVYSPEPDAPAAQVTDRSTIADYQDREALTRFAQTVDVVTYEFENIPLEPVEDLAMIVPVRPSPRILKICQDRLREKDFVNRLGIGTTRYRAVTSFASLGHTLADIGPPAVLKSTRMGYDGKGQVTIRPDTDIATAWRTMGAPVGILERHVDFAFEASVIVARGLDGASATFTPSENLHRDHILAESRVPGAITPEVADRARAIATAIAEALDLVGVLCVELFVLADGTLLVNELAPRPHNSGHWTIEACVTSQFEQLTRAITGLPLGSTERLADAVMTNLIGDQVDDWFKIIAEPRAKAHLYGKTEVRPGRKMGHVTRLFPRPHQR